MDEDEPLRSVIMLETPIMAPKEVTMKMKGHTTCPKILRIYPIMKVAYIGTYDTILIVASVVKTCGIELMSVVMDTHTI